MKRYFMICGFMALMTAFSVTAVGEEIIKLNGSTYRGVEVNGERYYLKESGSRARAKRSTTDSPASPSLFIGDTLRRDIAEPDLKINGGVFVRVNEQEAQALAQQHGLIVINSIGGITLFEVGKTTDIGQLAGVLQREGYEVQIEMQAPLLVPQ
ncbi:hypothetical protein WG219_01840 [Ectopseudomonas mendocina]|uniref:ASP external chaperone domain-containing protein n=1 Tax=Ectopseudomonas mendocina TaxID=300 RepID=A0ABZ2RGW4_ECTME